MSGDAATAADASRLRSCIWTQRKPRATVRWMHLSSIKCTLQHALGTQNISQATHLVCTPCSARLLQFPQSSLSLSVLHFTSLGIRKPEAHWKWVVTHRWPEFVDRIMMDYAIVRRSIFIEHEHANEPNFLLPISKYLPPPDHITHTDELAEFVRVNAEGIRCMKRPARRPSDDSENSSQKMEQTVQIAVCVCLCSGDWREAKKICATVKAHTLSSQLLEGNEENAAKK